MINQISAIDKDIIKINQNKFSQVKFKTSIMRN